MELIYSHGDLVISKLCDATEAYPLIIEHAVKNDSGCTSTLIICITVFLIAVLAFICALVIAKNQKKALPECPASLGEEKESLVDKRIYYVDRLISLREELAKKDSLLKAESNDVSVQKYISLLEKLAQLDEKQTES